MKLMKKRKKLDERVAAEINRIYKIGYLILTIGIGADIIIESVTSPAGIRIRPLETAVFFLAQFVCMALMVHKGLADDNQYAEADVFPLRHTLKIGLFAGLVSGAAAAAFRIAQFDAAMTGGIKAMIFGMMVCVTTVMVTVTVLLLQYLMFRLAKRRRSAMLSDEDAE